VGDEPKYSEKYPLSLVSISISIKYNENSAYRSE